MDIVQTTVKIRENRGILWGLESGHLVSCISVVYVIGTDISSKHADTDRWMS